MTQLATNGRALTDLIGALEFGDMPAALHDGSLENSAGYYYAGPSTQCGPMTGASFCHRIDDGSLEDSAGYQYAGPSSSPMQCGQMTAPPFCRR